MTDLGKSGDVGDVVFGVGDTFDVDGLRLFIDGGSKSSCIGFGDPLDANSKVLEGD